MATTVLASTWHHPAALTDRPVSINQTLRWLGGKKHPPLVLSRRRAAWLRALVVGDHEDSGAWLSGVCRGCGHILGSMWAGLCRRALQSPPSIGLPSPGE